MSPQEFHAPQHLAARAGLPVAPGYWPALLRGAAGAGRRTLTAAARRWDGASLVAGVAWDAQLVLLADAPPPGATRQALGDAAAALLDAAADVSRHAPARAVMGDRIGPAEPLGPVAARLWRAAETGGRAGRDRVTWLRHESLALLLDAVDPSRAAQFVEEQIGALTAHDRRHGTCLERVLELALDHADRNQAARAAHMHRNTFRRQLGRALALVDADLACPQERLALQLALTLRRGSEVGAACTASLGFHAASEEPLSR